MKIKTLLGGLSAEQFIQHYWQQKPLLIKQAIPGYECPLSAEELAGLALEEEVESRLVQQQGEHWSCRYGPFDENDFTSLPESHWTLLVQGCNRYLPEFAQLLELFDFLPAWRLDDIMVSYAADQGSVGPHLDQYDVFLLQAYGQREWRIAEGDFSGADYVPNLELKILSNFEAQNNWLLQPGDMLYLPPGVPHYGIAQGPCITVSVGFRAANASQMLNALCDNLLASQQEQLLELFYRDNIDPTQENALNQGGLIDENALHQFRKLLQPLLQRQLQNPAWIAQAVTQTGLAPQPLEQSYDAAELKRQLKAGALLCRDQGSRFAYVKNSQGVLLYANGEPFQLDASQEAMLKLLTGRHFLNHSDIANDVDNALLLQLLNLGLWYVSEPEEDND